MSDPCKKDHSDGLPPDFDSLPLLGRAGTWRLFCPGCAYELGRRHATIAEERRRVFQRDVRGPVSAPTTSSEELLPEGVSLQEHIDKVEQRIIESALKRTDGRKMEAARLLGVDYRSLRYRLSKYGIGDE